MPLGVRAYPEESQRGASFQRAVADLALVGQSLGALCNHSDRRRASDSAVARQ